MSPEELAKKVQHNEGFETAIVGPETIAQTLTFIENKIFSGADKKNVAELIEALYASYIHTEEDGMLISTPIK